MIAKGFFDRFRRKVRISYTNQRDLSWEETRAFDAAFAKMDEAFNLMNDAFDNLDDRRRGSASK